MSALRRSVLVVAACAMAVVLAIVAWWASSMQSHAPEAASAAVRLSSSQRSNDDVAILPAPAVAAPSEREATPTTELPLTAEQSARPTRSTNLCTLSGRALGDYPGELHITVAVFAFDGRAPSERELDWMAVDSNGAFKFSVHAPGEFVLLAFANDRRPATMPITITTQTEIALPPLVVAHGVKVTGELRATDQGACSGVRVLARDPGGPQARMVYQLLDGRFVWRNGSFEWAKREARTDDEGRFTLNELGRAEYSLSVLDIGSPAFDLFDVQRVPAPEESIVVQLSFCSVSVQFFRRGSPAESVGFVVRSADELGGRGFTSLASDAHGNATLALRPNSEIELQCGDVVRMISGCVGDRELDVRIDL